MLILHLMLPPMIVSDLVFLTYTTDCSWYPKRISHIAYQEQDRQLIECTQYQQSSWIDLEGAELSSGTLMRLDKEFHEVAHRNMLMSQPLFHSGLGVSSSDKS